MDGIRLLFLIGHLYLIGAWLSEDQRMNTIKTHLKKYVNRSSYFY
jgi:hypothetical protein